MFSMAVGSRACLNLKPSTIGALTVLRSHTTYYADCYFHRCPKTSYRDSLICFSVYIIERVDSMFRCMCCLKTVDEDDAWMMNSFTNLKFLNIASQMFEQTSNVDGRI